MNGTQDTQGKQGTQGIFSGRYRATSVGIVLGMSLVAFESLAVATIAPQLAQGLGSMALYGWIFSSFLLLALLGITVSGRYIDRHGAWPVLAAGLGTFGVGLLLSGVAPSMAVLLVGRALQGLGGGAISTALYAAVNLAYPDALRPRMMALLSTAWVVPTLVGPAVAGFIADTLSWRVVFLGIIPLLAVLVGIVAPSFRALRPAAAAVTRGGASVWALQTTLGAGLFLLGLSLTSPLTALTAVLTGILIGFPALRRLLPPGTLTARPGLGAVVASRSLFSAAFAGVQVFLAVLVTNVQGYPASVAGLVLASGSVSWTLGTWWQERLDKTRAGQGRAQRVLTGTLVLAFGLGVQLIALATHLPLVVTALGLAAAGLGIGFAHASASVLAFAHAPAGREGEVLAALQLADQFAPALSTGAAGALFALAARDAWGEAGGFGLVVGLSFILALLSALAAYRIGTDIGTDA